MSLIVDIRRAVIACETDNDTPVRIVLSPSGHESVVKELGVYVRSDQAIINHLLGFPVSVSWNNPTTAHVVTKSGNTRIAAA
jgi:hypothetical protein